MCKEGKESHSLPLKPLSQKPRKDKRVTVLLCRDLIENLRKSIELLRGKYYE
jgi:hypothetical protein